MVRLIFHVFTFPICAVVAVMDSNNGRGFWQNYLEVAGIAQEQEQKSQKQR